MCNGSVPVYLKSVFEWDKDIKIWQFRILQKHKICCPNVYEKRRDFQEPYFMT